MHKYRTGSTSSSFSDFSASSFVNLNMESTGNRALPYWISYSSQMQPSCTNMRSSSPPGPPRDKVRKHSFMSSQALAPGPVPPNPGTMHPHPHHAQALQTSIAKDPFNYPVPLPYHFPTHYSCAQSFIRRRNERERERVRYVNEGYDTLRRCLPLPNREKRISKVEILRSAIRYINRLERVLSGDVDDDEDQDQNQHQQTEEVFVSNNNNNGKCPTKICEDHNNNNNNPYPII